MICSPRASIIIASYNYARFLRESIDSALSQTGDVEVIVVDDGSTDGSHDIIHSCGDRIKSICKSNEGQASAINAGFAASSGEVVLLLDSDDVLLPGAVEAVLPLFDDPEVVKVHWPMRVIDQNSVPANTVLPKPNLSDGNLRDAVLRDGPEAYEWPPTSGNAWRRAFLQTVLPIPQGEFRTGPDLYLAALVPVAGTIRRLEQPQSLWRAHGQNNTWAQAFETRLPRFIRQWDRACGALVEYCRERGLPANPQRWRHNAWCHRVQRAVDVICETISEGQTFVLIDQNDWGADQRFFGRRCLPFLERGGQYWGLPPDDSAAIAELERQNHAGASFAVIVWPSFWWQQHYLKFLQHVYERHRKRIANDDVIIFELGEAR